MMGFPESKKIYKTEDSIMLMRSFFNDNLFDDFFGDFVRPVTKKDYPYNIPLEVYDHEEADG